MKTDNRLFRVSDLPEVIFLVDDVLKRTLFWSSKTRQWKDYIVRDPGCGPYFGHEFQRSGVTFDTEMGVFLWREKITMPEY